jgi:predicted exporter
VTSTLYKGLRATVIAIGIIGYAVLAHYSAATSAATELPSLGVAVALAPSLVILLVLAWRSTRQLLMALVCIGVGSLLWHF